MMPSRWCQVFGDADSAVPTDTHSHDDILRAARHWRRSQQS